MDRSGIQRFYLAEFEGAARGRKVGDPLFILMLVLSAAFFTGSMIFLSHVKVETVTAETGMKKIRVSVSFEDKKAPPKKIEKKAPPKAPVDLTHNPQLKGAANVVLKRVPGTSEGTPRLVYGLRRVFATGLGAEGSGDGSGAIVSKLGNTLEKAPDTLTATKADLKGPLVSVTTVTSMPTVVFFVKPKDTEEMKKNKVNGIVSVSLLVDIDGSVKEVKVLNDLGFGTREAVLEAVKQLKFKPALQDTTPVAVRIIFKYKFVFQEG